MAFSQGDAEVIARLIKEMETWDDVQRPETWDFVRWSDGGERRITEVDLSNRAAAYRDGGPMPLDLRALSELRILECSHLYYTSLDVRGLKRLVRVDCSMSGYNELLFDGCDALEHLECYYDALTGGTLDVSALRGLRTLVCCECSLEVLKLGHHPHLSSIACSEGCLKGLDLSGVPALEHLDIIENEISELDLSSAPALKTLYCSDGNWWDDKSGAFALPTLERVKMPNGHVLSIPPERSGAHLCSIIDGSIKIKIAFGGRGAKKWHIDPSAGSKRAAGRVETAYEDTDSIVFTMPDWDITVRAEPKRK